mmetsp:Transcript_5735/g.16410  ORF Transcript_5735/g.16410 Transcript_5735/m.16410 type:complete len:339 (-) Transcript_5735:264-1280(-)
MDWMNWLVRISAGGAGVVGVGLSLLYFLQEKLIYVPRIPGVSNDIVYLPKDFGFSYEDVWLTAADGTKLHSWFMWPKTWADGVLSTKPCILFFQENAGNMSWRLPFLKQLAAHLDCSIMAPSYRGYGLSGGKPSERGLQMDAEAALDYLLHSRPDIDRKNISLFGRSLGGAVAIHLAAAHPHQFKAVMVENTFTSIEEVAPRLFPFLRLFVGPHRYFNWLVRNKWDSKRDIVRLDRIPVLLLSSLKDEMLPPEQMRRLFTLLTEAGSRSLVWAEFEEGNHMEAYDICRAQYWGAMRAFAENHILSDDSDWVADDYEDVKEAAPDAQVMSAQTSSVRKR